MKYEHIKEKDVLRKSIHGIDLNIFEDIDDCGVVIVSVKEGHNQEFYDIKSTYHYIILKGKGSFFLNDEEIPVEKGDKVSILPKTRIFYKGNMKMILITNPPWEGKNEVETRAIVW